MNAHDFVSFVRKSRVVRVAFVYIPLAWFALRAILIALPGLDAPGWVPKLLAVLLLIGYPIALVASWAFDVGEDEQAETAAKDQIHVPAGFVSVRNKQTNPWAFGILLIAGLAILGSTVLVMLNPPTALIGKRQEGINSVAVLPFLNLSAEPGHQVFCDGLSEELLNLLTGIESLQVAARTSSFALRESNLDVPSIGDKLRVSHVLEGSVRRDGDNIRVTAQLVRSEDGFHIWSENYDRKFTQIFAIQDDIARNIVAKLVDSLDTKAAFDRIADSERTDPDAYFAYLQGRGALTDGGRDNLLQASQHFDTATSISPNYRPAVIGKLYTTVMLGLGDGQPLPERRELFTKANQLFDSAAPDVWAATAASVIGLSLYEWQRTNDILELGLGTSANDVSLISLYAELLLVIRDLDGAAFELQRIEELTPVVASAAYLRALLDYESSEPALQELFVHASDSRNWSTTPAPKSVRDTRRRNFRACAESLNDSDVLDRIPDACDALRSFVVPLLAIRRQDAAALEALRNMVDARHFDAVLATLPEVSQLLRRPEAAAATSVLALPPLDRSDELTSLLR